MSHTTMLDELVSEDLATLALASRRGLRPIDATLRALGSAAAEPSAPPSTIGARELALLAMSSVFARRVTRAAGGAVLLACSALLLVIIANPMGYGGEDDPRGLEAFLDGLDEGYVAIAVAVMFAASCAIAHRVGERLFETRLSDALAHGRDPADAGRRLLRATDGVSLALGLAGVTAFATLFVIVVLVIGSEHWTEFWDPGDAGFDASVFYGDRVRDLLVVLPLMTACAFAVGRACVRERIAASRWLRVLEDRRVLAGAVVVVLALLVVAVAYDAGNTATYWRTDVAPSTGLRSLLVLVGAPALFVVIAGFALGRRRGELERIGGH